MGTKVQTKVQIGKEAGWGTGVAATAIMSGVESCSIRPVVKNTQRRYLTGAFYPSTRSVQTHQEGKAAIAGDFTFEDFIYILLTGVRGGVTPTGAGDPKTWTFAFRTTAAVDVESRTIEMTDGTQEYELAGGLVESFSLSGEAGDDGIVKFSSNWIGKAVTASTITGALAAREMTVLPANMCTLAIDDIGGTIGTTPCAATLIGWSLDVNCGTHMKQFQSGAITPSTRGYGYPDVTLKTTLEFNAFAVAEIGKYLANTGRLVRILGTGPLISGSDYRTLTISFAGDITDIGELWTDRDGNTTVEVTMTARQDAGAFANYCTIVVVNNIAAVVG